MEYPPPDNSDEAMARRMLAWQYVLPKVVEIEPASPLKAELAEIIDLNANVFEIRPPDVAA